MQAFLQDADYVASVARLGGDIELLKEPNQYCHTFCEYSHTEGRFLWVPADGVNQKALDEFVSAVRLHAPEFLPKALLQPSRKKARVEHEQAEAPEAAQAQADSSSLGSGSSRYFADWLSAEKAETASVVTVYQG